MKLNSPTGLLLAGLAVILLAITGFSWYSLRQIASLRRLQSHIVDSNRKDSLQLIRIERDLQSLGLAMRDMLEETEPYPLTAWQSQFERIHADLDDALRKESQFAPAVRTPDQQQMLTRSMDEFWAGVEGMFAAARAGKEDEAKRLLRTTLRTRQAAVVTTVARLLVQNNAAEEQAAAGIQEIYDRVERNIYYFLAAMMLVIVATSTYMVSANRRLFRALDRLSERRRVLAGKLITMEEELFHRIARDLHDEFGQVFTAVGVMLQRAEKKGLPADSPLRADLQEVRQAAQTAIEKIRNLSQVLHPSVLDDYGLEKALEWQAQMFEQRTGIGVRYEKRGSVPPVPEEAAIHVYRILQEALNNVARHSQASRADIRFEARDRTLRLEVEDDGVGLPRDGLERGLGLIAMRERAELLQGHLRVSRSSRGGTLVALEFPRTSENPTHE